MASEHANTRAGDRARQSARSLRAVDGDVDAPFDVALEAPGAAAPLGGRPEAASFEEALEELDRIVEALEDGQISLDAALSLYERGVRLTKRCQEVLDSAELRVQRLRVETRIEAGAASYQLDAFADDENE
jgi:exodeoxyribonuclease VII small subunit